MSANRRLAALLLLGTAPAAFAAAEIPWAYSGYFGTGRYELGAGEELYVLGARPSRTLREAVLDEDGRRRAGLELRVPIAIGGHRFDVSAVGAPPRFEDVATVSLVPGIEIEIPLGERWSIKPLGYAGRGTELDGAASAWIYWAGIKSRWARQAETFDWALVTSVSYVGHASGAGERDGIVPLTAGIELARPFAQRQLAGEQVWLHWHAAYTYLHAGRSIGFDNEWEIGAAFSTGEQPLRLWRLRFDRVGVAYRFDTDGDFTGIGLIFRSLFDR